MAFALRLADTCQDRMSLSQSMRQIMGCRCDNITIAPALLKQLEDSMEPLERKLWPTMGDCDEPKVDLTAGQVSQPNQTPPSNVLMSPWLCMIMLIC